jgi:hypothetical protein
MAVSNTAKEKTMANLKNWLPDMTTEERAFFDKCPKAVLFEIARQFGMRIADDFTSEGGFSATRDEWRILHENGIVPQKPPKIKA